MDAPTPNPWSLPARIAFRFAFAYFLLYNLDFPLFFDIQGGLSETYLALWHPVVKWVGSNVLHVPYPIEILPNGSGDTTFNYVQVFCYLSVAAATTLAWSFLDRKRLAYPKFYEGLRVILRYVLFVSMLGYGLAKVFKTQFPEPGPVRLMASYSDSSPMGLLWTFMGYSTPYNIFTGLAEIVGGILLLARRTATLGALIVAGVMTNVVVLNFSYDVPVKLYSSHLLLMALFLLIRDIPRLVNFFVRNRPVEPATLYSPFPSRIQLAMKALAIGAVLFLSLKGEVEGMQEFGDHAPKPVLYGIWQSQTGPWRKIGFDTLDRIALINDKGEFVRGQYTLEKQRLTVKLRDAENRLELSLRKLDDGSLLLTDGGATQTLRPIDAKSLPLPSRGFHWISELPFNR